MSYLFVFYSSIFRPTALGFDTWLIFSLGAAVLLFMLILLLAMAYCRIGRRQRKDTESIMDTHAKDILTLVNPSFVP